MYISLKFNSRFEQTEESANLKMSHWDDLIWGQKEQNEEEWTGHHLTHSEVPEGRGKQGQKLHLGDDGQACSDLMENITH